MHLEDDSIGALAELLQLEEVVQPVAGLARRHRDVSGSATQGSDGGKIRP